MGGHQVKMARLKTIFEDLGFIEVETFIASGNVIFKAPVHERESYLQERIEKHVLTELGYAVPAFLRTPADLFCIAMNAPLQVPEQEPTDTLHVGFMHEPLSHSAVKELKNHETAVDTFACVGRELFWRCHGKTTDSLVAWPKLERLLKTNVTMRNMKTVKRLVAKCPV